MNIPIQEFRDSLQKIVPAFSVKIEVDSAGEDHHPESLKVSVTLTPKGPVPAGEKKKSHILEGVIEHQPFTPDALQARIAQRVLIEFATAVGDYVRAFRV